ncbi:MAG: hypothetical protein HQM10_21115 [Candidatus Riflebacteria bacterium]|nr:hypothetical protein [Candidatus Riflebacteria bacterium]
MKKKQFQFIAIIFLISLIFQLAAFSNEPIQNAVIDTSAKIDIVFNNTPLEVALQLIAEQTGKKIEIHVPMSEVVSDELHQVSIEDALSKLLGEKVYTWVEDKGTIHVFKNPVKNSEPEKNSETEIPSHEIVEPVKEEAPVQQSGQTLETEIIVLKNRKVEEIKRNVESLISGIKVSFDVKTNSLLLSGNRENLNLVASFVSKIDLMPTSREEDDKREYLSEVYNLEFVTDFDDLEKNLNFVLYGFRFGGQGSSGMIGGGMGMMPGMGGMSGGFSPDTAVPLRKEYYLIDRKRKVLMITASRDKIEILKKYFEKVNQPLPQVMIEVHILALEEGFEKKMGFNWNLSGSYTGPSRPTDRPLGIPNELSQIGGGTGITGGTAGTTGTTGGGQGFAFGSWNLTSLKILLDVMQNEDQGQILSQPKLMTVSGQPAKIHIGTQYPYKNTQSQNQVSTVENITYLDVGIKLDVTPQVNQKAKTIVMDLIPEVSDVIGFRNDAPIVTTRRTETRVEAKDNETIIIGGLIRDETTRTGNSVPILREIPLIKEFFKYAYKRKNRTNLVIMITPRIVYQTSEKVQKPIQKGFTNPKVEELRRKLLDKTSQ